MASNGMTWKAITEVQGRRKVSAANLLIERPGRTSYAYRYIIKDSPISAFCLFVDKPVLRSIQKYTSHGTLDDKSFSIYFAELKSFISLQIARGVLVVKNTPLRQLWSVESGHRIFNDTDLIQILNILARIRTRVSSACFY